MAAVLAVPVKISALFLEKEQPVHPPTADFSRLPYTTSQGDRNPGVAWLSEEIVPHPFEGATLLLKPGLHLHWTLPDTFLRGTNQGRIPIHPKCEKELDSGAFSSELRNELEGHGISLSKEIIVLAGDETWNLSISNNYRFKLKVEEKPGDQGLREWRLSLRLAGMHEGTTFKVGDDFIEKLNDGVLPETLAKELSEIGILGSGKPRIQKEKRWYIEDTEVDRSYPVTLKQKAGEQLQFGVHSKGIVFPVAPNRWLVERRWNGDIKRWVVESDYLSINPEEGQTPIWFPMSAKHGDPPCRRLGRQVDFKNWSEEKHIHPERYVRRLTAMGYGDPGFAAFYPSCHSVFGFYDPEISESSGQVEYQVIGWHSNPADDPLRGPRFEDALNHLYERYQLDREARFPVVRDVLCEEALVTVHGWSAGFNSMQEIGRIFEEKKKFAEQLRAIKQQRFPQRAIMARTIMVDCENMAKSARDNAAISNVKCEVAIGHTVTEALSAFAASKVDAKDPPRVEDQIEALHLFSKIEGLRVDVGPKFREARHEKEFAAVDAGRRWTIVPRTTGEKPPEAAALDASISPELKQGLQALNKCEADVDRLSGELAVLRRQLYSDWCKYMICAYPPDGERDDYPDMDEARAFIEGCSLSEVKTKLKDRREARKRRDEQLRGVEKGLEGEQQQKLAQADDAVHAERQQPQPGRLQLTLKTRPASRFWQPKEPVLLIEGSDLLPTTRHDSTELLQCQVEKDIEIPESLEIPKDQLLKIDSADARWHSYDEFRSIIDRQPWNPIFLDWQIELMPAPRDGSGNVTGWYPADYVTSGFQFSPECADLTPKEDKDRYDASTSMPYQGRSILTPHGGTRLRRSIEEWMWRRMNPKPDEAPDLQWARKALLDPTLLRSPIEDEWGKMMCRVYGKLFGDEGSDKGYAGRFMAQALTGFHAAMLMQRQTLQLPVADPLGFKEDRDFAHRVAKAVAGENLTAPQPQNHFHPVLAGEMKIHELRLVDTFGQARNLSFNREQLITAESMTIQDSPHVALLRPRIVQPSRVKFRWLAADVPAGEVQEANDHRTALCGWMVHDVTRDGLLVHAADGTELGRISNSAHWHSAPGRQAITYWQIDNPHLARLVASLVQHSAAGTFFNRLDDHLGTIVPAEFAEHDGVQLLLGRPLAVVRARLELQIYALPASNQEWAVFQQECALFQSEFEGSIEPGRTHDAFDKVKFPFRLGDVQQLNDGLAAFWEETLHPDGRCTLDQPPQTSAERMDVQLSVAGDAVTVTMLMDPRAPVHVHNGILPAKSIALPKAHYAEIMARMSAALPVGPLLCPQDRIALYTPDTTRFAVSWMEHDGGQWIEAPITASPAISAEWSAPIGIREGWIKLTPKKLDLTPKKAD